MADALIVDERRYRASVFCPWLKLSPRRWQFFTLQMVRDTFPISYCRSIDPKPWGGVYVIYDRAGLAYVGRSYDIRKRLLTHARSFPVEWVKVARLECEQEQKWLERKLLFRVRPRRNRSVPTRMNPWERV